MKQLFHLLILLGTQHALAQHFDESLLANNKESFSRQISKSDQKELGSWLRQHSLDSFEIKRRSVHVLGTTMKEFLKRKTQCDLGLPTLLTDKALSASIIRTEGELPELLTYLRDNNLIDDLFYKNVKDSYSVNREMQYADTQNFPRRPFNLYTSQNADLDVKKIYSNFKTWPDEIDSCSLSKYLRLVGQLKSKSYKDRDSQVYKLNYLALQEGVISTETYHKLDVLRRLEVLNWHININGYLEVLKNAKDKMATEIEPASESVFNEKYVSRKERLTRRGRLYKVFSSTQIMMLAQLIEKTAKRMDARYVNLNFQFTDDPDGETEIYVLSPMEQYRVSIKMLRKDMGEIMLSDTFRGTGVEYEDLISSAFETGLIKSYELEPILKFEEFWNPKTSRWKTYANFSFGLAGTASFFLPTPFNVIGAIALVVTQSKIMNKKKPSSEDNWNAIL